MGDTLRWVLRPDTAWSSVSPRSIQCEFLAEGERRIGVVWYQVRSETTKYKKNQWYYSSFISPTNECHEAANQEEAKALCIMLCKLNQ